MLITKKLFFILILLSISLQLNSAASLQVSSDLEVLDLNEINEDEKNIAEQMKKLESGSAIEAYYSKFYFITMFERNKQKLKIIIQQLSEGKNISPEKLEQLKNRIQVIKKIFSFVIIIFDKLAALNDAGFTPEKADLYRKNAKTLIDKAFQAYNKQVHEYNEKLKANLRTATAITVDPLINLLSGYVALEEIK